MVVKRCTFPIAYGEIMTPEFMERYHFEAKDTQLVTSAVRLACEMTEVSAEIGYEDTGVTCAVTLGDYFDRMTELFAKHLLVSYCMECTGMEMLARAYERVNRCVYEEKQLWIRRYRFPGETGSREGLCALASGQIEWRDGMLHPLKSVVFTAEYTKEREKSGCEHCASCGNVFCVFRKQKAPGRNDARRTILHAKSANPYSYGIQRIFENTPRTDKNVETIPQNVQDDEPWGDR